MEAGPTNDFLFVSGTSFLHPDKKKCASTVAPSHHDLPPMHCEDRHAALRIHLLEALAGGERSGGDRLRVRAEVDESDLVAVNQLIQRLLLAAGKMNELLGARAR